MQKDHGKREKHWREMLLHNIQKKTQPVQEFRKKLDNDWMMSSAGSLAYNLLGALIPIAVTLISILGFTIGRLDPAAHDRLIHSLRNILPAPLSAQNILGTALATLSQHAGLLAILSLLIAIYGGSQLFIAIEGYFNIIYRRTTRKFIPQHLMALRMLLIFIILTPLMIFASSIPALMLLFLENAAIHQLPGIAQVARSGLLLSVVSVLESLIVAWLLFQTIYMVVPNQKMSFKKSWKGAVVAAVLLEIFLSLFPFYITHFMGSYTGEVGFLFISLFFFYYFAVILLIGAEINAFFAEGVRALPENLADFIHRETIAAEDEKAAD